MMGPGSGMIPQAKQRPREVFTLEVLEDIQKNVPNVRDVITSQYVSVNMMQFAGQETW